MSRHDDICRVEIVFSKQAGGPKPTVEEVAQWVTGQIDHDGVMEGYSGMRYSKGRVVAVELVEDRHDRP